jgi:hypothetical protein
MQWLISATASSKTCTCRKSTILLGGGWRNRRKFNQDQSTLNINKDQTVNIRLQNDKDANNIKFAIVPAGSFPGCICAFRFSNSFCIHPSESGLLRPIAEDSSNFNLKQ